MVPEESRDRGSTPESESNVRSSPGQPELGVKGKSPARAEMQGVEGASFEAASGQDHDSDGRSMLDDHDDHDNGLSEIAAGDLELADASVEREEQNGVGLGARTQSDDRDTKEASDIARLFMQSLQTCAMKDMRTSNVRKEWCRQFKGAAMGGPKKYPKLIELVSTMERDLWRGVMRDDFDQNRGMRQNLEKAIHSIRSPRGARDVLQFIATMIKPDHGWKPRMSAADLAKLSGGRSRAAQEGQGSAL
eukprot:3031955-Rhodomonas_salina.1